MAPGIAYGHEAGPRRKGRRTLAAAVAVLTTGLWLVFSSPALAVVCTNCGCSNTEHSATREGGADASGMDVGNANEKDQETLIRELIDKEFSDQEKWFNNEFLDTGLMPQLQRLGQQMISMAMYQMFGVGTLLDSKMQLETQRVMQKAAAEAQSDYYPAMGVCVFGTNVRSLASAERRGEYTRYVMSQRAQERQLGHRNALGADGLHYDLRSRLAQYKERYCDTQHNAGALAQFCGAGNADRGQTKSRDINFGQVVDQPRTLEIDFTDGEDPTNDEIDIFALADNLYGRTLLSRIPEANFQQQENREKLIDLRSAMAKRSVAENSFYTIVGMKSLGSLPEGEALSSQDTSDYMKVILRGVGVPEEEIADFLSSNPSYFAQMEVLTKRVFQRPAFYADLYDKPANIERKSVSMLAVQLMQNFDLWDSYLRQEQMLSVWLELDLKETQDDVSNRINRLRATNRRIN